MNSKCLHSTPTCSRLLMGAVMMDWSDFDRDTQRALLSLGSVALSLRDSLLLMLTELSTSFALNGDFAFVPSFRKSCKQ